MLLHLCRVMYIKYFIKTIYYNFIETILCYLYNASIIIEYKYNIKYIHIPLIHKYYYILDLFKYNFVRVVIEHNLLNCCI